MNLFRLPGLASLLLTLLLCQPGQTQSLSLRQVTERMEAARSKVEDITARAAFDFRLTAGILPYSDSLSGTYYFKKPDRHRLDFPDAPSYLKSVPSMFSWKLPAPEKYDCLVKGPFVAAKQAPAYHLLFSSKNPDSKTKSITVVVDAQKWRIARQETRYKDGGSVLLDFGYIEQKGLPLLQKVSGQLDIPSYKLKGTAALSLSEQRVNEGVDNTVFTGGS